MTVAASPAHAALDAAQLAQFKDQGYIVLERFIEPELNEQLKREVDTWVGGGPLHDPYAAAGRSTPGADQPRLQLELPEHGRLISHPPLMARLEQLMGTGFAFHHLHTARHDAGSPGVHWHHDYEQTPQVNRSHVMVHVFYYLNGLDGTIGDLLVLPRSHREVYERGLFGSMFGTVDLPGSVTIDRLPPGSAVIVHSGLLHARRAKPGGEGHPRYFIDCSYCQAGVRWPEAHQSGHLLRRAMELGLDRGGRYAHLFDPAHFHDNDAARERWMQVLKDHIALSPAGSA